jgi:hypothetical protein
MEAQEKNLSQAESLAIIQNMIATAKNNITDDGFHFMLWGVLVIIASIAQYLLATQTSFKHNELPWLIMPLIGLPTGFIYESMKSKKNAVRTRFEEIIGLLWGAAAFSLFIIVFIAVRYGVSPVPFILALIGLATCVTGSILKFKALIFGAFVFWIAAIAACLVDPLYQLLINGIATFLGYIIPGILLWRNYKAQIHV